MPHACSAVQPGHAGTCRVDAGHCLWGCEHTRSHSFVPVVLVDVVLGLTDPLGVVTWPLAHLSKLVGMCLCVCG